MPDKKDAPKLSQFALHYTEKVRFSDTDKLGHVNNNIFGRFFESGRVAVFYDEGVKLAPEGTFFVIAHLAIDFLAEINWPSEVEIGTSLSKIGRSSMTCDQALFVDGKCVARANSVIVLMDEVTRKSTEMTSDVREHLAPLLRP